MKLFQVENAGPEILSTNYFETEHAALGYIFLSVNAGAFRLLLPPTLEVQLAEMKTGRIVVISRGRWRERDALEIMFDDGSRDPYCLHLGIEQVDRLPSRADDGRDDLLFSVWTSGPRKVWECRCAYRMVATLPCLEPWKMRPGQ